MRGFFSGGVAIRCRLARRKVSPSAPDARLIPRPIAPQRLERQTLADCAESIPFDDASRWHCLDDRLADMGEPHRAAGQEYGVDVIRRQLGLIKTKLDAGRDARGQLPRVADQIGPADRGSEPWRDPFERNISVAPVRQGDLGLLDLHRQRVATLFVDDAQQPIDQFRRAGLAPHLTQFRQHAGLVHAVDARPGGQLVKIA